MVHSRVDSAIEAVLTGLPKVFRRLASMVRGQLWRTSWRGIRTASLLRWMLSPYRQPRRPGAGQRRLLVYDFSKQPISVGDLLVARVAADCLRIQGGASRVDMAFLCEPPVDGPAGAGETIEDIGRVLQGVRLDPELGSVMLFWLRTDLEEFIDRLPNDIVPWPPAGYYASGQYVYYLVWNELLHECFHRCGRVPELHAPAGPAKWAAAFVEQHAGGRHAVSVQLRLNLQNPARNSDFDAWLGFFEACSARCDPYVFIIVGRETEVDPRLAACPNVVLAKTFYTSLDQDLALIEACAGHMGAASGPSTMAFFNRKPYVLFGWRTTDHRYRDLEVDAGLRRFYFGSSAQRLLPERETAERIDEEFQLLRAAIEVTALRTSSTDAGADAAAGAVSPPSDGQHSASRERSSG